MASPPSDIRSSVRPSHPITANVDTSVSGTGSAATSPARRSRRNRPITISDSATPSRIASRTPVIDSVTSAA